METTARLANEEIAVDARRGGALRGYLELVRPANLVTAAADVLAGSAAGGAWNQQTLLLMPASMLLYAGGVVANDFFDRDVDRVERPERAIPSGRVTAASAGIFGGALLTGGIAVAFSSSALSGWVACAIALAALVYDAFAKHQSVAGPLNMGLCRGLNLLLGVTAVSAPAAQHVWLALVPLLYIAAITSMAAGEVRGGNRLSVLRTIAAVAGVLIAVPSLGWLASGRQALWSLPFLALLAYRVGPPLWRALAVPEPRLIFGAVKAGVLSLIILDAAIAGAYLGIYHGLALVALMIAAGVLARLFAVT